MASSSGPAESGAILRSPEEPPGLDRVRRFLARPLAAVRFVWLWARWIGIHLGRGLAVVGRSAYRGARVAQAAGAVAESVGKMGNRLDGMGQNWSRAGGRLGRVGGRLASAGRRMRSGGSRWADTARGAAGVGVALGEIHEAITGEAPEGEKPVVAEPVVAPVPEALPEPEAKAGRADRASPPTPPSPPPAVAPATTGERPGRGGPAERGSARDSQPVARRSRRRSRRAARAKPDSARERPADPVEPDRVAGEPERPSGGRPDSEGAVPAAAATAPPTAPTASDSAPRAERPPAAGDPPADEPGGAPPAASSDSAPPPASEPSSPIADASRAARTTPTAAPPAGDPPPGPATSLPGHVPEALREAIRNLGERPRRADLRAVITRLCAGRWTTGRDLAAWLGVNARNLRRRHLDPMAAAGLLERRELTEGQKIRREYRAPERGPE